MEQITAAGASPAKRPVAHRLLRRSWVHLTILTLLVLAQGIFFISFYGPFTCPDYNTHVPGAYALATGQSFNEATLVTDELGNQRRVQSLSGDSKIIAMAASQISGPRNDTVSGIIANPSPSDTTTASQMAALAKSDGQDTLTYSKNGFANRGNTYAPLAWLPQAIGIKIGLLTGVSPYLQLQFGRVASLALYLVCAGLALVLLPRFKDIALLIAANPVSVFCAASMMCDGTLLATALLAVAATIHLACSRPGNDRLELACIGACAFYLAMVKAVYLPVALGFYLLPKGRLKNEAKLLLTVVWLLGLLLGYLWSIFFGDTLASINLKANGSFMRANLLFVCADLLYNALTVPLRVFSEPAGWFCFCMHFIALSSILNRDCIVFRPSVNANGELLGARDLLSKYRWLLGAALAGLISLLGIFFFFAYTWNDLAGASSVGFLAGMQERYYLPLLPLFLFFQAIPTALSARRNGPAGAKAATATPEGAAANAAMPVASPAQSGNEHVSQLPNLTRALKNLLQPHRAAQNEEAGQPSKNSYRA